MGFSSNLDKVHNPATRFYRWKGGVEKIKNVDGSIESVGGKLSYWDGDAQENVEVELPFAFCPLEITYSYGGFKKDVGRIWSNEIVDFKTTNVQIHVTGETDEVVIEGLYNDISEAAYSRGARLQANVYAYVPALDEIVRLNLSGSAKTAWKEFARKKNIYEHSIMMSAGEVQKSQLGEFIPPKYELCEGYDDEAIKTLREKDDEVLAYLKYVSSLNQPSESSSDGFVPQESPAETSQENPLADDAIDLSEIPF